MFRSDQRVHDGLLRGLFWALLFLVWELHPAHASSVLLLVK